MVSSLIRDSFFGRLTYHLSGKRWFTHPEEKSDFVIPEKYLPDPSLDAMEKEASDGSQAVLQTQQELSDNGRIMVDWESEDDLENPKNWPITKKLIFILQIGLLTVSIYIGSSIYVPGIEQIMADMGVGQVVATLPLSLFVIGYGIGPMVFSPLSEHPAVGRTYIYIVTLFLFVILQVPTALCRNIAGLCVLRFLSGFICSPALATGGASFGDILTLPYLPVGLACWGISCFCGPVLGPLIGGVLSQLVNVYWTFWFLCILGGVTLLILVFCLPETSQQTLLYRKARRLRAITGNHRITSTGDLDIEKLAPKQMAIDTLYRPMQIALSEPMVLSINCYIALVYAVFYTFFEAFPIILGGIYQFNLIQQGVSYVAVATGILLGCACYVPIILHKFTKPMLNNEWPNPEVFIPPAIMGALFMPTGLFIFGWAATARAHWIGTLIGAATFSIGGLIIFQTLFNYLAFSFPRFMASVYASNGLFRSTLAGVFPLFARAMYTNTGSSDYPVGWGCTILGIAAAIMIGIPIIFYKFGPQLRGRSKFAGL